MKSKVSERRIYREKKHFTKATTMTRAQHNHSTEKRHEKQRSGNVKGWCYVAKDTHIRAFLKAGKKFSILKRFVVFFRVKLIIKPSEAAFSVSCDSKDSL